MTTSREPVHRSHFIAQATPAEVYAIVVDFPAYPRLFPELKEARVLSNAPPVDPLSLPSVDPLSLPSVDPLSLPSVDPLSLPSVVRVEFRAHMVLPVRYVLDLTCVAQVPSIDWVFVEGEVVTNSTGGWRFTPESGGTRVDYHAALDVRAPLPGLILRKITDGLVSASLPRMFQSIEAEVRRRRAGA